MCNTCHWATICTLTTYMILGSRIQSTCFGVGRLDANGSMSFAILCRKWESTSSHCTVAFQVKVEFLKQWMAGARNLLLLHIHISNELYDRWNEEMVWTASGAMTSTSSSDAAVRQKDRIAPVGLSACWRLADRQTDHHAQMVTMAAHAAKPRETVLKRPSQVANPASHWANHDSVSHRRMSCFDSY